MKKKKLNICVLTSNNILIQRSGIGVAIRQQISILNQLNFKNPDISVNKVPLRRADIVHINTVFPDSVLKALYAKLYGCRIIYFGHSTKEDWKNSFKGSNLSAPFIKLWFMFCYQLGDVIITPTAYSKKILKEYGIRKPIFAVSNGIDTEYWKREKYTEYERKEYWKQYGISSERKIIMSVGHYMERKGFPEFCNLARKNPDIDFIWFGFTAPDMRSECIKRALQNIPGNLYLPGFIGGEKLKKAYTFSDLFLFLSHEETEGIVVSEALAMETPMIVRDIPVYESWLKNNVNTYMFRSGKELKELIPFVLSHDNSRITSNARKSACLKDFNHIGEKYLKVYEKMKLIRR